MLNRFLGFLGFVPGLAGLSGLANSGGGSDDGFEAEGEAQVAFQPGAKLVTADDEDAPGDRQARLTDRDLVWPGKTETIQISNPESVALRFDLTVTDLDGAFYIRRPATGGTPQREGGVLLQPDEEASFEVVFVPPPGGVKTRSKTFSFVLTCFDPRRSADPGEIVQDLPLRWVALPSPTDFQILAVPPFIVTRPWRREARFAVKLTNKSFLPPAVGLSILRAPTKDALDRGGETVGTVEQALSARTAGIWQMTLPPPPQRGSYYAAVRGTAQTADAHSVPLALPRPVVVRYQPWLRMGRDWLFLLGVLLLLFWLAWGIPVHKTPIVRVSLAFAGLDKGQVPTDSRLEDLTALLILTDERGHDLEGQTPLPGVVLGDAFEFKAPPRWYGYRWMFGDHIGWNGFSRVPQHFRITLAPAESEKAAFKRYDLNTLLPDGAPAYTIETAKSPYGTWVTPATYVVQSAHGVFVNLRLGSLGALTGKELGRVSVSYALDGEEQAPRTFQLLHDGSGHLRPLTLDLTDAVPLGTSKEFTVKVTAEGLSSYDAQPLIVHRQDRPFAMTLAFPLSSSTPQNSSSTGVGAGSAGAGSAGAGPAGAGPAGAGPAGKGGTVSAGTGPPGKGGAGVPNISHNGIGAGGTVAIGKGGAGTVGKGGVGPVGTKISHSSIGSGSGAGAGAGAGGISTGGIGAGASGTNTGRIVVVPPPPPVTPPTPGNLAAQPAGPSQVRVAWSAVPGVEKYVVYRTAAPGQNVSVSPVFQGVGPEQTSLVETGLAPGTIYFFQVQARTGSRYSPRSGRAVAMTQVTARSPVAVGLVVNPNGRDLQATLSFTNQSAQPVFLDKISACLDGKIGDAVFLVTADGRAVPFNGRKTPRPAVSGPRQFASLAPGETQRAVVDLGRSYRLPPGQHAYSVAYDAVHNYPARFQTLTLRSDPAQCTLSR